MSVNTEFQGKTYPASGPYAVDAATITAFADAVGASDPMHRDAGAARAAGYTDVIAPPTFAVSLAQQCDRAYIADPEAGIDYSRVVHGEQKFVHHRPISAGDVLTGELTVASIRETGGHTMITTRTELTADSEPVCTSTSTIVVRGKDS